MGVVSISDTAILRIITLLISSELRALQYPVRAATYGARLQCLQNIRDAAARTGSAARRHRAGLRWLQRAVADPCSRLRAWLLEALKARVTRCGELLTLLAGTILFGTAAARVLLWVLRFRWRERRRRRRGAHAGAHAGWDGPSGVTEELWELSTDLRTVPPGAASCCAICLEEMKQGESMRVVAVCGHCFHACCADPWFARQASCPLCRATGGRRK